MPPMMFTEMGVHRRDSVTINGTDLPSTDPGSPTNGEPGGGVINGNPDPELPGIRDMIMRARWHYDLRTNAENAGIGWTTFTYIGGFGIREGSIHGNLPNNSGTDYMHPGWRSTMYPYMADGLFGDDRP